MLLTHFGDGLFMYGAFASALVTVHIPIGPLGPYIESVDECEKVFRRSFNQDNHQPLVLPFKGSGEATRYLHSLIEGSPE